MSIEPTQAISTVTAEKVGFAIAAPAKPNIVSVHAGNEELLRITPTGEVIAPSLEAASEAGRVFVDSIRHHLQPSTPASGEVVAWMYECGQIKHTMSKRAFMSFNGIPLEDWTETPLYAAPSHPAADLVEAATALLNYEGHHAWCGHGEDMNKLCVCGLISAQDRLRAALSRYAGGA